VFGGQHRLAELSADSKPQTTKSFATIAVFFDNQILASLELPAFLCLLPPDRSAPEFLQGSATMTFTKNFWYKLFLFIYGYSYFSVPSTSLFVKDVAYWRYALNSKHVCSCICTSVMRLCRLNVRCFLALLLLLRIGLNLFRTIVKCVYLICRPRLSVSLCVCISFFRFILWTFREWNH
jgi:hypothetical protein